MNRTILFLFLAFHTLLCSCENPQPVENQTTTPYMITGRITDTTADARVVLSHYDPVTQQKTPLDTSRVEANGSYSVHFDFEEPDLFRLDFPGRQYAMLAIDEGQSMIEVNIKGESNEDIEILGSEDSQKLLGYEQFRSESNQRLIRPTYAAMRAAAKEVGDNPVEEIKAIEAYVEASEQHRKELLDYTEEHIGTSIALYGTMLRWTGDDEVSRLEGLVSEFKGAHPGLKMTKAMEEKVERYKKVAIGVKAPSIAEKDTAGTIVRLYDTKGKVTLIDFWASWCGPCLRQVPDLREAYAGYHDKGFEIFGVSVDTNGDKWKSSIDRYKMTWPNVSNLKGWGSEAAAAYNVTFVPFNVLIDAEGRIIAKNLHSKALQSKLAELLD